LQDKALPKKKPRERSEQGRFFLSKPEGEGLTEKRLFRPLFFVCLEEYLSDLLDLDRLMDTLGSREGEEKNLCGSR